MDPEEVVNAVVTTIIGVVLLVILITIFNQDVGMILVDYLPHFIKLMLYGLIIVIVLSIVASLLEEV